MSCDILVALRTSKTVLSPYAIQGKGRAHTEVWKKKSTNKRRGIERGRWDAFFALEGK